MATLSHCSVGSNRLDEAKALYEALPGSAGITPMFAFRTDEGAPGERAPRYYFSDFRNLDGNKLCAWCMGW